MVKPAAVLATRKLLNRSAEVLMSGLIYQIIKNSWEDFSTIQQQFPNRIESLIHPLTQVNNRRKKQNELSSIEWNGLDK